MNVITNINVSYNVGLTETATGLIEGHILIKTFLENGNIRVTYKYLVNDEEIKHDNFNIASADIQAMYDLVKAGLPDPGVDFMLYMDTVFYEAMKIEMVNTFADLINVSEIDLIA